MSAQKIHDQIAALECPNVPAPLAASCQGLVDAVAIVRSAESAWVDWLAREGYGTDYAHDTDPPCTLRELAEAYYRIYPSDVTVDEWEFCITSSTDAFRGEA